MSNEELAAAVQAGDNDLMGTLWNQCYGFIRQMANRWARAWENRAYFDADDLTQSGYIALYKAVKKFEPNRGGFLSFLEYCLKTEFAKVAGCRTKAQRKEPLNNAISLDAPAYRNNKNDEESEITIGETIPDYDMELERVEDTIFNAQIAEILHKAMDDLTEKQRAAIELYYFQNQTYNGIAQKMNCSITSVEHALHKGMNRIKTGVYASTLFEMLYGEINYYRHTSLSAWKNSGSSSPEWELLRKEDPNLRRKINYCVERLGFSLDQAKDIFPV
jgi:RNA polymerase sporulation-specific sigma factor